MSWLHTVSSAVWRRNKTGVVDAVREAANAVEVLDQNCQTLGIDVVTLDRRVAASEALHCDHAWALSAMQQEIAVLKRTLTRMHGERRAEHAETRAGRSASADRDDGPHVPASDLCGFVEALPCADVDEDQIATAVRTLVTAAWVDLRREPVAIDRFPWAAPILLLASAPADRLEAFLDLLTRHRPSPALWLIGRPRDARIAAEMVAGQFEFLEYTAPGPFAARHCEFLPALQTVPFGALVFLDTGLWGDRLTHCSELLQAVAPDRVYCFGGDSRLYHLQHSPERARAQQLTRGLLAWYDARLVPTADTGS